MVIIPHMKRCKIDAFTSLILYVVKIMIHMDELKFTVRQGTYGVTL